MKEKIALTILLGVLVVLLPIKINSTDTQTTIIEPTYSGLGVGPSIIGIGNALRGAEYTQMIFIFNPNYIDINVTFDPTGEIKSWVSFYDVNNTNQTIKNLNVPQLSTAKMIIKIKIPENISNGLYEGSIFIVPTLNNATLSNMSSSVILKVPVEIKLNVTGIQDLNISVESITIDKTEIGYPLDIKFNIINTGNVIAKPKIVINITKDGIYIDKIVYQKDEILPREFKQITVTWNTTGMVAGTYVGNLTIFLNNRIVLTKNLTLNILPPGSLKSSGKFIKFWYEGTTIKGETIKLFAKFRNTGGLPLKAKFIGEVYLNNHLLKTIESQELDVKKYSTRTLISYLDIEEEGKYVIKGYIAYGGNITEYKTLIIDISSTSLNTIVIGGTIIGIITLSIIFIKIKIFRKVAKIIKNKK